MPKSDHTNKALQTTIDAERYCTLSLHACGIDVDSSMIVKSYHIIPDLDQ